MPENAATRMVVKDHFCSNLKTDIAGAKNFLALIMTTVRTKATIEPPKNVWRKP